MKCQNTLGTSSPLHSWPKHSGSYDITGKSTSVGRHLTLQFHLASCLRACSMQGKESYIIEIEILAAKASGFQEVSVGFRDVCCILLLGVCTDGNDQSWKPKCSQPWNYGEVELGSILSDCLQACLDLGWSIKWSQIMTPSYGPTYLLAHVTWRKSSLQENGMPERNPMY